MGKVFSRTMLVLIAVFVFFYQSILSTAIANENTTRVAVTSKVVDFVDRITETGILTCQEYETFIRYLDSTGVLFKVTLEHQHQSISPSTAGDDVVSSWVLVGKEAVLDELYTSGSYHFAKGDLINVTVVNQTNTVATVLKLQGIGADVLHTITAKHGGTIRDER